VDFRPRRASLRRFVKLASITAVFAAAVPAAGDIEAPPPESVFPVRGHVDWGEAGARFGAGRGGHVHEGQDVFAPAGTPLVSVRRGKVVEKGDDGGRGNYVAIWSGSMQRTFVYLHMRRPSPLGRGDRVRAGQRIGAVGCTGSCWGDHLHLELRSGRGTTGRPRDPLPLLRKLAARAKPARAPG
jgi:murein DD-endopeptidase MepM/ murein hydrolase activator NlpD